MSRSKESVIDLSRLIDKKVRVKMIGGREVVGVLQGYDPLLNMVLDQSSEFLRDQQDQYKQLGTSRQLGLVICRGTAVMLVAPDSGTQEIENPFLDQGEDDENENQ